MKPNNFQFILFLFIFLIGLMDICAQNKKQKNICMELKEKGVSITKNQVLVIGEILAPDFLENRDEGQTLLESITRLGGMSRKANIKKIHILRCSEDFQTVEKNIFVDYRKVKYGTETDLAIEGGAIIIVRKGNEKGLPKNYFERKGGISVNPNIKY